MMTGKLIVGVTGASGAIYAQRLLINIAPHYQKIHLIISDQAIQVAETELGVNISRSAFRTESWLMAEYPNIELLGDRNYFTPPASGSYLNDGMVIVPCSMGTLGRIAAGISNDLLTRSADVALKEARKLILVPREMPMSLIMLRNMVACSEAGATLLPACPAWYHNPKSLEELADTVVARIMQALGLPHGLHSEWKADG